ncbi:hypothetical protein [Oceanimonas marisflavi]|uniref:hypothetical protein n=1 Tax=Oceanimonas marisflavi TaxID=2059724 RepID=UPI000D315DC5|nr:hypothetical protein [Oceanimonas marisflavi]
MKESDWKKFRVIKEQALDRFCTQILSECEQVITHQDERAHQRYLALFDLMNKRDEEVSEIFDGHSRSQARLQLLAMRSRGLADDKLVAELSEEFQAQTNPHRS